MLCKDDAVLSDSLKRIIRNCKDVYLEVDMDNIFEMMGLLKSMKMRNDTTLADLMDKKDYERVKTFFEGKGCDACGGSGYQGRIGIHEVLTIDGPVREAILRKSSAEEIQRIAVDQGMTPMLEDGILKAAAGITTITEVLRILHE